MSDTHTIIITKDSVWYRVRVTPPCPPFDFSLDKRDRHYAFSYARSLSRQRGWGNAGRDGQARTRGVSGGWPLAARRRGCCMTGRVIPMRRLVGDDRYGTVHVMQLEGGGYEVGHESASGKSWGNFSGRIDDAQQAIVAAHALNREQYGGRCAVSVCDAAASDTGRTSPSPLSRGDF